MDHDRRALLEATIREQYSNRGDGRELSDDEVKRVADVAEQRLNEKDGWVAKFAQELRDGKAAKEMSQVHVASGIHGGLAMLTGLVRACPSLSAARRSHLIKNIQLPEGIRTDHYGSTPIDFPAGRGEGDEMNRAHRFYVRCAEVEPEHDFKAELDKLRPFVVGEEEGVHIEEVLGSLLLQARMAYIALLDANADLERTIKAKFAAKFPQFDFNPRRFHAGQNKTLYFRVPTGADEEPKKASPCAGLVVEPAPPTSTDEEK